MTHIPAASGAQTEAGTASAEDGLVVLDGPGIAVTMTPEAALLTGQSLLAAAAIAVEQNKRLPDQT
jgi:hypothetical protein